MSKRFDLSNFILCSSLICIVFEKWTYYAVLLILMLAIIKIITKRKVLLDVNILLLSIFCTCSLIATNRAISLSNVFHEFSFVILYFAAINYYEDDERKNKEPGINTIIIVIALAYITRLFATIIMNTISGYIFTNAYLIDPVTKEATSPTLYSPMMIIPLCVWFYLMKRESINKFILGVYTVLILGLLYVTTFMLARRMVILIFMALLVISVSYTRKLSRNRLLAFYGLATIGVLCFFIFGQSIVNKLSTTYFFERFSGIGFGSTSRWDKVSYYLSHFFDNLSGGNQMRQVVGYAHNLWLDVYDTAGIVPLVALLFATIIIVVRFLKNRKKFREEEEQLLMFFFAASYIHFLTEPAYYSLINYMWVFAFVSGYISKRYRTYICCVF